MVKGRNKKGEPTLSTAFQSNNKNVNSSRTICTLRRILRRYTKTVAEQRTSKKSNVIPGILATIRIRKAMTMAPGMDKSEVDAFLAGSKTPLRLATTNSGGEPNIHPVWYHYTNDRLYLMSTRETVKVRNMNQNKTVYFSVDTDAMPNRGVKGKGTATMIKDQNKAVSLSEKIVEKYLGDINSKMAKNMIDAVRKGSEVLVEITPQFYSTWDYTKSKF